MGLRRLGLVLCAAALMLASGCGGDAASTDASDAGTNSEAAVVDRAKTVPADAGKEPPGVPANDSEGRDQFGSLAEAADFAEEVTGQPAPIPRDLHLKGDADVYI